MHPASVETRKPSRQLSQVRALVSCDNVRAPSMSFIAYLKFLDSLPSRPESKVEHVSEAEEDEQEQMEEDEPEEQSDDDYQEPPSPACSSEFHFQIK
jgi:hypothetical protein